MTNLPDQDFFDSGVFRLGSVGIAGVAIFCFLIARHGARGLLDIHKPWRPLLVLLCGLAALCSGFRANLIFIVLTFAVVFYLEGLVRSKYFPALLCLGVFTVAIGLPFTRHMPLSVQRTISFLPVDVDPIAMNSAEDSTNWRLEMWQEILPTLPTYFWKGKGFTFDREKLAYIQSLEMSGYIPSYETSLIAGDYHSGPLSVIVPFGIWGVIAFLAFVYAGGRALYLNYKYGDPALKTVNRVLFALYVVRFIFFIFIFGSLYSDLIYFASLAGFGISLNGGAAKNPNYQRRTVVKYG